jgi:hypothetical protein
MNSEDRAKGRYGKKSHKKKTWKDKDETKWNLADAKEYMDSKEGQDHAAKMHAAQQLMQQDQQQAQQPDQLAQPAPPAMNGAQ